MSETEVFTGTTFGQEESFPSDTRKQTSLPGNLRRYSCIPLNSQKQGINFRKMDAALGQVEWKLVWNETLSG